jgi:hypothetical protein
LLEVSIYRSSPIRPRRWCNQARVRQPNCSGSKPKRGINEKRKKQRNEEWKKLSSKEFPIWNNLSKRRHDLRLWWMHSSRCMEAIRVNRCIGGRNPDKENRGPRAITHHHRKLTKSRKSQSTRELKIRWAHAQVEIVNMLTVSSSYGCTRSLELVQECHVS